MHGYRWPQQTQRRYSCARRFCSRLHGTATLQKSLLGSLSLQTFGYSTEEFEVTPDRLGVYLCVVSHHSYLNCNASS